MVGLPWYVVHMLYRVECLDVHQTWDVLKFGWLIGSVVWRSWRGCSIGKICTSKRMIVCASSISTILIRYTRRHNNMLEFALNTLVTTSNLVEKSTWGFSSLRFLCIGFYNLLIFMQEIAGIPIFASTRFIIKSTLLLLTTIT